MSTSNGKEKTMELRNRDPVADRPLGKRWLKARRLWVHLQDEAPTIGSGYRPIWYIEGRKWAFIAGKTGRKRLKMAEWLTIKNARRNR
jgi:hypothetical protein